MKKLLLSLFVISLVFCATSAQKYTLLTDEELIKLYSGLRVADVSDGMDLVGLHDQGLMDQSIEALWKDIEKFDHQICGIAVTVRYIPTNRKFPTDLPKEEYEKWVGSWYGQISPEPFVDSIHPGSVVVIDNTGDGDTGTAGSNNIMTWTKKGMVGLISTGGVRDTDEIIKQRIPVYMNLSKRGRGIRPGRNEIESVNKPIVVGDALVNPGDVIVADGDGVIVVPREHALQVGKLAYEIMTGDQSGRAQRLEDLDKTTKK